MRVFLLFTLIVSSVEAATCFLLLGATKVYSFSEPTPDRESFMIEEHEIYVNALEALQYNQAERKMGIEKSRERGAALAGELFRTSAEHANAFDSSKTIRIDIYTTDQKIHVSLHDTGKPFDPNECLGPTLEEAGAKYDYTYESGNHLVVSIPWN